LISSPLTVGLPGPEAVTRACIRQDRNHDALCSPPFSFVDAKMPQLHSVISSTDVLGDTQFMMVFAPRRLTDADPKLTTSFIAALDVANAIISADKVKAA
jgi:NitT/TauT family transport system substrate-binding protein